MIIWKFNNLEQAKAEQIRVKLELDLPESITSFEILEDDLNGVFTFPDEQIAEYIDFDLITEKEYKDVEIL